MASLGFSTIMTSLSADPDLPDVYASLTTRINRLITNYTANSTFDESDMMDFKACTSYLYWTYMNCNHSGYRMTCQALVSLITEFENSGSINISDLNAVKDKIDLLYG